MRSDGLKGLLSELFHLRPKYVTLNIAPKQLETGPSLPENMPKHVAIIMDGNGRWAEKQGLPRSAGHAAGTEALREIIRASDEWGILSLTIYAFSTENWVRPKDEVSALMGLLLKYFTSEIDELDQKGVRIRVLGDMDGMPEAQRDAIYKAMARTEGNPGLKLNICLNYGGREDLLHSVKVLAGRAQSGALDPEALTEADLEANLRSQGIGDVDLLIRTSGEMRLSNFLPWQCAYAEMVFNRTLWPDYDRQAYLGDIRIYAERHRRYGGVK